ncbi:MULTISPECIES: hypothetical protein [Oscillatoriales]|uniref:hypothetical protein n=1 Tax=Oscillatoriales TaxID=1150 RepID=UPI0025704E69|nr:hypothetical protein [Limnospira sp. Paracas R14]
MNRISQHSLLSEILQCLASAPILPFDVQAIAVFQELRSAKNSSIYNGSENGGDRGIGRSGFVNPKPPRFQESPRLNNSRLDS